jgi:hypothetical protein
VDVVLRAANSQSLETVLSRDPAHVRPKPGLDLRRNCRAAFLSGKDTVKQRATIGV